MSTAQPCRNYLTHRVPYRTLFPGHCRAAGVARYVPNDGLSLVSGNCGRIAIFGSSDRYGPGSISRDRAMSDMSTHSKPLAANRLR